jgi:hypothetical protein
MCRIREIFNAGRTAIQFFFFASEQRGGRFAIRARRRFAGPALIDPFGRRNTGILL